MMKSLRKYKKQIMVFVVLFAMFSFIGGSALYNLAAPNPDEEVIMTLFGREVTQGELKAARNDTDILETIFLRNIWKYHPTEELSVRQWLMLAEEAKRANVVVPDDQIDSILQQFEEVRSLDDLRVAGRYSRSMIRRALGRHLAIQTNAGRVVGAAMPSEPQIEHYARATQDKVQVKFVALEANQFLDEEETFSEAAMQAQFEEYKDVDPEENKTGFGYRHPRRVKIQYVEASIKEIQSQIEVSLDEVKTHWKGKDGQGLPNKERYKKTVYVDPPQPTSGASLPVEKPKQIPEQRVKSFTEARPDIENELKKNKAMKISRQIMNKLADELARPWNELQIDPETGYKPVPTGLDDPGYMKAALTRMEKRFGVSLKYEETKLLSKADLDADITFSNAETPGEGNEYLKISELAFRVPPFYEAESDKLSALRLQLFQTPNPPFIVSSRSFRIVGGQLVPAKGTPEKFILFRVIEAQETGAATELAEVREEVERDLRLMKAFESIEPTAKEFCTVSRRLGVEDALPMFDDLRTNRNVKSVSKPAAFARWARLPDAELREALQAGESPLTTASVAGVGKSKAFIDACFEMGEEDWTMPKMDQQETKRVKVANAKPAADPAPKVRLVPVLKLKKWFIIELVKNLPVNSETYETQHRATAFRALQTDRSSLLWSDWFLPENIEKRCQYVDARDSASEDENEGDEASEASEPAKS